MAITALRATARAFQMMILVVTGMRRVTVTLVRRDAKRYPPLLG
jgi:hypothetical protein